LLCNYLVICFDSILNYYKLILDQASIIIKMQRADRHVINIQAPHLRKVRRFSINMTRCIGCISALKYRGKLTTWKHVRILGQMVTRLFHIKHPFIVQKCLFCQRSRQMCENRVHENNADERSAFRDCASCHFYFIRVTYIHAVIIFTNNFSFLENLWLAKERQFFSIKT